MSENLKELRKLGREKDLLVTATPMFCSDERYSIRNANTGRILHTNLQLFDAKHIIKNHG